MKVGSSIHRKENTTCSSLIAALDRNDPTCFYHEPRSAFAPHAFQYDFQGFPYDPQGFQCDVTFHQPMPMDAYFEDYGILSGGLRRSDQNLSTACFEHYSVPPYLEHDPLGIMNFSEMMDQDDRRHSSPPHPPVLCDRSYGRNLMESSPIVSNGGGSSSSGTISTVGDDRHLRHPPLHRAHHHQQQHHHRQQQQQQQQQQHPPQQQHNGCVSSAVANVPSPPSSASAKNSQSANLILKEVRHAGVAARDDDTSPAGYSFCCETNTSSGGGSGDGGGESGGVVVVAGCRKRKTHHPRCKETDENMMAKRHKHNAMEKVRRRVVADGFEALARVLRIKTGRKPSKATILIKAKESIQALNSHTADVQRDVFEISEKRIALARKLDSLRKM